jgi:hypothetical protein
LRPIEYNVTYRHIARRSFGGDIAAFFEGDPGLERYVKFFQTTRNEIVVGIVEIEI